MHTAYQQVRCDTNEKPSQPSLELQYWQIHSWTKDCNNPIIDDHTRPSTRRECVWVLEWSWEIVCVRVCMC